MTDKETLQVVSTYLVELGSYLNSAWRGGDPMLHLLEDSKEDKIEAWVDFEHSYDLTQATWLNINKDKTDEDFKKEITKFRKTNKRNDKPFQDLDESQKGEWWKTARF